MFNERITMMLIKCPSCGVETENHVTLCPVCGYRPENIDGFDAWAPEFAQSGSGEFFHLESFQKLAALEDANFWFQSRNELLLWALNHFFTKPSIMPRSVVVLVMFCGLLNLRFLKLK